MFMNNVSLNGPPNKQNARELLILVFIGSRLGHHQMGEWGGCANPQSPHFKRYMASILPTEQIN